MPEVKFTIDVEPDDRYVVEVDPRALAAAEGFRSARVLTPVAPTEAGLVSKLSAFCVGKELGPADLNETGRERKITLKAHVRAKVRQMGSDGIDDVHVNEKPIFMEAAVPNAYQMSVTPGVCPSYANPASNSPEYATRGGYSQTKGNVAFMNSLTSETGAKVTAAAIQMAKWYYENEIVSKLNDQAPSLVLPYVPMKERDQVPSHATTCAVEPTLLTKHSADVINYVYHALRAEDVLVAAGVPVHDDCVWNLAAELNETTYDVNDFWEAYRILRFSAGGGQSNEQFDAEFMLALAPSLALHGNCDEGGAWRCVFSDVNVEPNRLLAVSPYAPGTAGHKTHSNGEIVAATMNLQALVSRALAETELSISNFILPLGSKNEDFRHIVAKMEEDICAHYSNATGLPSAFWQQKMCNFGLNPNLSDRHLKKNQVSIMANYSPYVSTYSVDDMGTSNGRYSYDNESTTPLTFMGSYDHTRLVDGGRLFVLKNPVMRRKLQDGDILFDGRMTGVAYMDDLQVEARAEPDATYSNETIMDDGRTESNPYSYTSNHWRDNGDLFPCAGDGTTSEKGKLLVAPGLVPDFVLKADYKVQVSRYQFATIEAAEGRGVTRRSAVEARVHLDLTAKGSDRPTEIDIERYLLRVKRYGRSKTMAMKKRLEKNAAEVKAAALIKAKRLFEGMQLEYEDAGPIELAEKAATNMAKIAQPVLESVVVARQCYLGEDEFTTNANKEILIKAKKSVIKQHRFIFVGQDQLKVKRADGTEMALTELSFGAVPSARVWKPSLYSSEVGLLINKMNAVVNTVVSHTGAVIMDAMGEDAYRTYYDVIQKELGAAKMLLTEPRDHNPYFFSKAFAETLVAILGDTRTTESTPTVEQIEEEEQE